MDPEFRKRLLATYRIEAEEHLDLVRRSLLSIEEGSEGETDRILQNIYREFHSLKGAARAANQGDVESVAHRCEDLLSALSEGKLSLTEDVLDRIRQAVTTLSAWHRQHKEGDVTPGESEVSRVMNMLDVSSPATYSGPSSPSPESAGEATPKEETAAPSGHAPVTVRTPVARLDSILYRAEEMLGLREEASQRVEMLATINNRFAEWRNEWGKTQADSGLLRFLLSEAQAAGHGPAFQRSLNQVHEFLTWNRDFVENLRMELVQLLRNARSHQGTLEISVDRLLDDTKEVLMVPFSYVLETVAVIVGDSERDPASGKKARMQTEGSAVEIDRRVLEAMKDPFIHLVRNALDHGIETSEEREQAGKPVEGMIRFAVAPLGDGTVEVTISDDGRGVDVEEIRSRAVEAGILSEREASELPAERVLQLLFEPNFSSRSTVGKVSGRGLGLNIVKEKVENLGGSVSATSSAGKGTTFRLFLPLTLARFRGVEVTCKGRVFVLPSAKVRRVGRVRRTEIRAVNGRETISFRSRVLPLIQLRDILGLPDGEENPTTEEYSKFLTIGEERSEIALGVDDVGEERETVMKGLGAQLRRVRHIAGISLHGAGRVVPVININDILRAVSAGEVTGAGRPTAAPPAPRRAARILVVEDSITARTLLKNILEGAGYRVVIAGDGVEGIDKARTEEFDLLLTDIEMPRLDGIELTKQIRADERLRNKPVVILTARASREDREHGIEAGADAYIIKSRFDQNDLLETIAGFLDND